MAQEQKKSEQRSPKKGMAKLVKKKAPKPTEYIEVIDSEEDDDSPIPVPSRSRQAPTKKSTTKFQEVDFVDTGKIGKKEVLVTAAERVKMRRRAMKAMKAVKKGGAAARVPEFDEDTESDDKNKIGPKTKATGPRTKYAKPMKSATSSKANADSPQATYIDKGCYNDVQHSPLLNKLDATQKHTEKQSVRRTLATKTEPSTIHNGSSQNQVKVGNTAKKSNGSEKQKQSQPETERKKFNPRKELSETSNRATTQPTSNANIVIGSFSGKGLDPSSLVGLHIKKMNVHSSHPEKYPILKLVEGEKEVYFTTHCERHDPQYHDLEMDLKLDHALGAITEEKPVKIAEAVAGTRWKFAPKPVRKGYGEHSYKMVGLRLEGMDDIGWIWGRESKNGSTIFSYCDVIAEVAPKC